VDDLTAFLAARLAEAWSAARDRELAAGLDESPETRMIDACRAILDLCATVISDDEGHEYWSDGWAGLTVAQRTMRQLAAVYSGHPDYRPEWKP